MSDKNKAGLPEDLKRAIKQADDELAAMTARQRKKAEEDYANIDTGKKKKR